MPIAISIFFSSSNPSHKTGLTNNITFEVRAGSVVATASIEAEQQKLVGLKNAYYKGEFNPLRPLNFTVEELKLAETDSSLEGVIPRSSSSTRRSVGLVKSVVFTVMVLWGCTSVLQVHTAPSTRKGGEGLDTSDWMALLAFIGLLGRAPFFSSQYLGARRRQMLRACADLKGPQGKLSSNDGSVVALGV